ncbi:hypothetical protein ARMSODRAFT_1022188 [Armillaria solidipes]|uniref:Uncharacterized protein n=1 Tax=Armillaria solidipes TaxID=1076256 RepID=A0A2H3BMG2_9AGAR|nr:hypothetical protein ARMSODRAFT_1022188 [Armillaria solidipes]
MDLPPHDGSPEEESLVVQPCVTTCTWHDFISDEDPVNAAMALEMQNTPPKVLTCCQYYRIMKQKL